MRLRCVHSRNLKGASVVAHHGRICRRKQKQEDHKFEPSLRYIFKKKLKGARRWWGTPLIPALGRQRQAFEANLVYKS